MPSGSGGREKVRLQGHKKINVFSISIVEKRVYKQVGNYDSLSSAEAD